MTLIARAVVVRLIQDWWSTDLPLARSHLAASTNMHAFVKKIVRGNLSAFLIHWQHLLYLYRDKVSQIALEILLFVTMHARMHCSLLMWLDISSIQNAQAIWCQPAWYFIFIMTPRCTEVCEQCMKATQEIFGVQFFVGHASYISCTTKLEGSVNDISAQYPIT